MDIPALLTLSCGLYVVGSRKGDRLNAQISNSVVQVTDSPSQVAVSINRTEFTHECMQGSGAFTVAVLSEEAPLVFIGRFGFRSGRDTDKFEGVEHGFAPSGCPFPTQHTLACMDLRVVGSVEAGAHTVFIGELQEARLLGRGRPMTYAYYREVLRGKTPPTAPSYSVSEATRRVGTSGSDGGEGGGEMKRYVCSVCGYVYDPAKGDPESGVEPGVKFEDLPEDWVCPVCGAAKTEFEAMEE